MNLDVSGDIRHPAGNLQRCHCLLGLRVTGWFFQVNEVDYLVDLLETDSYKEMDELGYNIKLLSTVSDDLNDIRQCTVRRIPSTPCGWMGFPGQWLVR